MHLSNAARKRIVLLQSQVAVRNRSQLDKHKAMVQLVANLVFSFLSMFVYWCDHKTNKKGSFNMRTF